LSLGLLSACRSYADRTAGALAHFQSGRFEEARVEFADEKVTGSPFLAGAEAGI
jgi:hypothetical protein